MLRSLERPSTKSFFLLCVVLPIAARGSSLDRLGHGQLIHSKSREISLSPLSIIFISVHSEGCQLKNVPTERTTAAYISERSRNSRKLKKYDWKIKWVILLQLFWIPAPFRDIGCHFGIFIVWNNQTLMWIVKVGSVFIKFELFEIY